MNPDVIIKNREYYRRRIKIILPFVDLHNLSILDLGAGELILRDELVNFSYKSYFGVDSLDFQNDVEFKCSDIFDFGNSTNNKYNLVFCLGVLDHLPERHQYQLIDICNELFTTKLIISKANESNFVFRFIKKKFIFQGLSSNCNKLYLIKFPFTQQVFLLKKQSWLSSLLATEVVYIFNKKG